MNRNLWFFFYIIFGTRNVNIINRKEKISGAKLISRMSLLKKIWKFYIDPKLIWFLSKCHLDHWLCSYQSPSPVYLLSYEEHQLGNSCSAQDQCPTLLLSEIGSLSASSILAVCCFSLHLLFWNKGWNLKTVEDMKFW